MVENGAFRKGEVAEVWEHSRRLQQHYNMSRINLQPAVVQGLQDRPSYPGCVSVRL